MKNLLQPLLFPFGQGVHARQKDEIHLEEVYNTIPALTGIAKAAVSIGNKLGADAYHALFHDTAADDPGIRQLQVQIAMTKRDQLATVQPDMAYLQGHGAPQPSAKELSANDDWMTPAGPAGPG